MRGEVLSEVKSETKLVGQTFHVGEAIEVMVLEAYPPQVKLGIRSTVSPPPGAAPPIDTDGRGYFVTHKDTGTMLIVQRNEGAEIKINGTARLSILAVDQGRVRIAACLS